MEGKLVAQHCIRSSAPSNTAHLRWLLQARLPVQNVLAPCHATTTIFCTNMRLIKVQISQFQITLFESVAA